MRRRRRHELVALLIREPAAGRRRRSRRGSARPAGSCPRRWPPLACAERRTWPRRPAPAAERWSTGLDGRGCVLVPDPDGPGRAEALIGARGRRARAGARPAGRAGRSWANHGRWRRRLCGPPTPAHCRRGPAQRRRPPRRPAAASRAAPRPRDRRPAAGAARRAHAEGARANAGDRRSPTSATAATRWRWQRSCTSTRRPPATASPGCASCSATSSDDPDARFELEIALRAAA